MLLHPTHPPAGRASPKRAPVPNQYAVAINRITAALVVLSVAFLVVSVILAAELHHIRSLDARIANVEAAK